jgi:hypothetical protein
MRRRVWAIKASDMLPSSAETQRDEEDEAVL